MRERHTENKIYKMCCGKLHKDISKSVPLSNPVELGYKEEYLDSHKNEKGQALSGGKWWECCVK